MMPINGADFNLPANMTVGQFVQREHTKNRSAILFLRTSPVGEVHVDKDSLKAYSAECHHYLINNLVGDVIGSLFIVNNKKMNFNPTHFYVRENVKLEQMSGHQTEGLGGVFIYSDDEGGIVVIPAHPPLTNLVVVE